MHRRPLVALTLIAGLSLPVACGDSKKPEPKAEKAAEEEMPTKEEKVEKAGPVEVKLDFPWLREKVAGEMKAGTVLTYALTGTDAKGKEIADDYRCEVKTADGKSVGTVCNTVNQPSEDKGASMVATRDWTKYSPFFAVEKPKATLVEVAEITVPAGSFKTVVVELKDFFGANYKVWMIADKPGIYAKVEEGARGPDDRTAKVYELTSIAGPS
ncbi:MAG TPA: hypothetical protein ENJ18_00615 [Nannocystis exedens]|nr:hypothetical protein [Nannocystis exedens]